MLRRNEFTNVCAAPTTLTVPDMFSNPAVAFGVLVKTSEFDPSQPLPLSGLEPWPCDFLAAWARAGPISARFSIYKTWVIKVPTSRGNGKTQMIQCMQSSKHSTRYIAASQ